MEINVDNRAKDVDVEIKNNEDGSINIRITEKSEKRDLIELKDVEPGDVVLIGNREYIVLKHNDYLNYTYVITKDSVESMKFGADCDYLTSRVRKFCNEDFYNELVDAIGEDNIGSQVIHLICDDGSNKGAYCQDRISLITTEDYRRYRKLIPSNNETNDDWWTVTGVTSLADHYNDYVCVINNLGAIGWDACNERRGVRPFCIVKSCIMVEQV